MEDTARAAGPPPVQERSAGELVKLLSEQVSLIVRDELRLAELEMKRKGKQAGSGVGMLGGGGLVALYGVGCLLACAIIAISGVVAAWLAALIVGAALMAIAAFGGWGGSGRRRPPAPPVPREAAASVRADLEEIRERARQ
jgi:Putative Actinobacterial Holin-X, holin superfamily III